MVSHLFFGGLISRSCRHFQLHWEFREKERKSKNRKAERQKRKWKKKETQKRKLD